MSTGPMKSPSSILLICNRPELHYDTLLGKAGFDVVNVSTLQEGLLEWRPFRFKLVLIVVENDLQEPLKFCEGLKKMDKKQSVAFVTGWHMYVPPLSCPDEVIQQEYNPAMFLKKVGELAEA